MPCWFLPSHDLITCAKHEQEIHLQVKNTSTLNPIEYIFICYSKQQNNVQNVWVRLKKHVSQIASVTSNEMMIHKKKSITNIQKYYNPSSRIPLFLCSVVN